MSRGVIQKYSEELQKLGERCRAERVRQLEHVVDNTFLKQREYFIFRIQQYSNTLSANRAAEGDTVVIATVRVPIGSLSQLRKQVPCRFSTLREQWIAAGLPLRRERHETRKLSRLGNVSRDSDKESFATFVKWLATFGFRVEEDTGQDEILFYLVK